MINIALKTEFSFKQCYLPIEDIHKYVINGVVGVADYDNTYAHIPLSMEAEKHGFKPIYGVRLRVSRPENEKMATGHDYSVFIAKNHDGLIALYKLVSLAYKNFYYFPRLKESDIADLHPGIINLGNVYENFYPTTNPIDRKVYQIIAGARKGVIGYNYLFENKSGPMHIIPQDLQHIADQCDYIKFEKAPMIKFPGKMDLMQECINGASKLGVDIDNEPYKSRLLYEYNLIHEKQFQDYFKIVATIIKHSKKTMLVGPGRGSSGGSLLCYLLGITTIDPIKYGLLFERFIDVNRYDFPDIDTDYPPEPYRKDVIKSIIDSYGEENVKSIGTILTYKAKSAINDVAMVLGIPFSDTEELKSSIIERSGGDARAAFCVTDTFTDLEVGKRFIAKYPKIEIAGKLEGHAVTPGTHAAGILISNKPLHNYCSIDYKSNTVQIDGPQAEKLNLLKIDCLGLRTLAVLMETAKLAKFDFSKYYELEFNDPKVFKLLTDKRYSGIFQFDGQALGIITNQMGVDSFDDMIAITALSRPGALNSGGAAKYIKRRIGQEQPEYFGEIYERVTKSTYGVVIFQEQTMQLLREVGNLSWGDVNILRKAMSKSYGDEFFSKYKAAFMEGAAENNYSTEEAEAVWKAVASMGSYGFNKSHAVAYSMISYWTAWSKVYHNVEFVAANLNHEKSEDSSLKILRDFVSVEKGKYIAVDPDISDVNWTIHNGVLIGGLTNIDGIGEKKAAEIVQMRKGKKKMTPAIFRKLLNPKTKFDILFKAKHYWGHLYNDPKSYNLDKKPSYIKDIILDGEYTIIGCVYQRDLRSRNDAQAVMKRGGTEVTENIYYLNLYLEDDTDVIKCTIPPYKFDDLNGQTIAETSIVGKTWYLVRGTVSGSWRNLIINQIINLNELFGVNPE